MAKKQAEAPKPNPGQKAYLITIEKLAKAYKKYAAGDAEDDDFPTPAKQKKVAKQLANHHNRLLKKVPDFGIEELDADV